MNRPRTALVLTGGGARAAYQAGVLLAVARLSDKRQHNPFPILCGTSAGAINAVALACQAVHFGKATSLLANVWRNMHAGQIYHTDPLRVAGTGARWLSALSLGWLVGRSPRALLDNSPLRALLARSLDLDGIDRAVKAGALYAVSVTASGYASGESISFFQGNEDAVPWQRVHRHGLRTSIQIEHLLASSAIPFIFPAIRLHREYFGDGSMRQLAPISPAVHLGAERIMIIGAGRLAEPQKRTTDTDYPTLAQIAGHALASIFLDSLSVDIERMERINRTLLALPEDVRKQADIKLKPLRTLVIHPSQRLDRIAADYAHHLPWTIKTLLTGIGAMNRQGSALTSYLLFEKAYTRALVDLGYEDAMKRAEEIGSFLDL